MGSIRPQILGLARLPERQNPPTMSSTKRAVVLGERISRPRSNVRRPSYHCARYSKNTVLFVMNCLTSICQTLTREHQCLTTEKILVCHSEAAAKNLFA